MRTERNYNKIVNFDEDLREVTILERIFEDGSFKGAVGSVFTYMNEDEYKEQLNEYYGYPDAVSEYWEDNIGTFLSYSDMLSIANNEEEIERLILGIDSPEESLIDDIREELNLSEKEAFRFNFSSGGRCFDKHFEGNINTELSEVIRNIES